MLHACVPIDAFVGIGREVYAQDQVAGSATDSAGRHRDRVNIAQATPATATRVTIKATSMVMDRVRVIVSSLLWLYHGVPWPGHGPDLGR